MPGVTVRPVSGRRDLRRFIEVPFAVNRKNPQWVPPLVFERKAFLDRRKNPYFDHAEVELFLAERDGRAVGTISAQVDHNWDAYHGGSDGQFGFFECEDDSEAAKALFDAATGWLAERGRERALGPMDFTTNDELGVMIEGFDYRPVILERWNPPYYSRLFEENGFTKEIDLLMWHLEMGKLKEGLAFHPAIHEAAQKSLDENGITIRSMRRSDIEAEIARFHQVYNEAWGDNWGFVPLTDDEVKFHARALRLILDEDWAMIAEKDDGTVVGAALTLPDVNQVLVGMGGSLFPFGWLKFLTGRRKIDTVRILALGVRKEWQQTGAAAAMYVRHMETTDPDGVMKGEAGWILETNEPMNRALEGMGGVVRKKFRIYGKAVAGERPSANG